MLNILAGLMDLQCKVPANKIQKGQQASSKPPFGKSRIRANVKPWCRGFVTAFSVTLCKKEVSSQSSG